MAAVASLLESLARQRPRAVAAVALAVQGTIAALDFVAGPTISLAPFLSVPPALAAWFAGGAAGSLVALLGAAGLVVKAVVHGPAAPAPLVIGTFHAAAGVLVAILVSQLNRAFAHARVDSVTGLPDPRTFHELAAAELHRCRRYRRPITLVSLDVNDFRGVNQRFGRAVGDALLRSVAATLRRSVRSSDVVARLGNDDFVILLPETGDEAAQGALRKLEAILAVTAAKTPWDATFSIAATTFVAPPETIDGMLGRVDALMVAVKKGEGGVTRIRWETERAGPDSGATIR